MTMNRKAFFLCRSQYQVKRKNAASLMYLHAGRGHARLSRAPFLNRMAGTI
jgi:hypothetical protein